MKSNFIPPVSPIAPFKRNVGQAQSIQPHRSVPFDEVLKEKSQTLILSKHAQRRISERNIQITESLLTRMEERLEQASQKGVKEALILADEGAFIVNVPKKTMITALDVKESKQQIFTNINGTIIL
ncbi:MAG: TIGR02530 family flagellar biosynthesis protein [Bacilli bacterium]